MKSRLGRHTATASTWMLRFNFCKTRNEAIKLVQRGRVKIFGNVAQTGYRYSNPKPENIEVKEY